MKMKMRIARDKISGKTLGTFAIKISLCRTLVPAYKTIILTGKNGTLSETRSRNVL